MRKTDLKRTTTGVVIVITCIVLLLGAFRALVRAPAGLAEKEAGAALFQETGCTQCHYTDSRETRIGPGLEDLFERETLPASGRPVSEENVRRQLESPYENMPSFADELDREQMNLIIDYLKTL
ncbi:MAG: cytochrome c [Deltaproteobacteria bacterium]|nr:cytochrome c [Deltaproteobacteria bacterium]